MPSALCLHPASARPASVPDLSPRSGQTGGGPGGAAPGRSLARHAGGPTPPGRAGRVAAALCGARAGPPPAGPAALRSEAELARATGWWEQFSTIVRVRIIIHTV